LTSDVPKTVGLIAGNGRLPFAFARSARARGVSVAAVAIREETDPDLERHVDRTGWYHVGELSGMIGFLKDAGCRDVVMAGQIRIRHVFEDWEKLAVDPLALDLLKRMGDRRGDSVLGAVADVLEASGLHLREATTFMEDCVARPGVLTKREPSAEERDDLDFGWRMAKAVSQLALGQTVVVKRRAVVAVEAAEGTDACILRGGQLGGEGTVVVKVPRPDQDPRFDLPVIGASTVRALCEARAAVLAVEAGRTLILDREEVSRMADEAGIAIVVLDGPPQQE